MYSCLRLLFCQLTRLALRLLLSQSFFDFMHDGTNRLPAGIDNDICHLAIEWITLGKELFEFQPRVSCLQQRPVLVVARALPSITADSRRRNPTSPSSSKISGILTPVRRSIS